MGSETVHPRYSVFTTLALIFMAGAATMLLLHLHVVMSWESIYSKYPWQGQEEAMANGVVNPQFSQSTLSFNVVRILLAIVGCIVGFLNWRLCLPAFVSLWAGATVAPALVIAAHSEAYGGQFGSLAVAFVAVLQGFFVLWPILGGVFSGAGLGLLISRVFPAQKPHAQTPPVTSMENKRDVT